MNAIFLPLFVVAVTAAPFPEDASGSNTVVVNGVPAGAASGVNDIVEIKQNEHANGAVVATNLLNPYTAVGVTEAAAAAPVSNEVSVVEGGMARNVHSMPKVISSIHIPNAPGIMIPGPIVAPPPVVSEAVMEPEQLPVAAPQYNNEIYSDGHVQRQYNGPQEPGMLSTLQSWFNTVVSFFYSPSSGQAAPDLRR